jgi:hypothetical protein
VTAIGLAAAGGVFSLRPIAQNPAYHNFADARRLLGVPNLLNVASNLPFAIVGVLGLGFVFGPEGRRHFLDARERWPFAALFLGVGLTALGSGYYHLQPDNARLFWDRLPMTVAFMGVFAIVLAERVSVRVGVALLGPLVVAGAASALYWRSTELQGQGDLRPYLFVQFFPLLAIPLLLFLFPPRYTRTADWFIALGWYALAKVFEEADGPIYALGHVVSGHTLKHLAAAAGSYWLYRMLCLRQPVGAAAAAASESRE